MATQAPQGLDRYRTYMAADRPPRLQRSGVRSARALGSEVGVLAVVTLAAFFGSFLGAFTKDMGSAAGKASAEALRTAARRLRDHLRQRADKSRQISIVGKRDHCLLVVENVDDIPDAALEQLVDVDLPDGPGRITWDAARGCWKASPDGFRLPSTPYSRRRRPQSEGPVEGPPSGGGGG